MTDKGTDHDSDTRAVCTCFGARALAHCCSWLNVSVFDIVNLSTAVIFFYTPDCSRYEAKTVFRLFSGRCDG